MEEAIKILRALLVQKWLGERRLEYETYIVSQDGQRTKTKQTHSFRTINLTTN